MAQQFKQTHEAAAFLTERGVPIAPQTLRRLRVTGGGPAYFKPGPRVVYRTDDLEEWAAARLGAPRHSTTEAAR